MTKHGQDFAKIRDRTLMVTHTGNPETMREAEGADPHEGAGIGPDPNGKRTARASMQASGNPTVFASAKRRKKGGRVNNKLAMQGARSKHRMDRRARGGGADTDPLASSHDALGEPLRRRARGGVVGGAGPLYSDDFHAAHQYPDRNGPGTNDAPPSGRRTRGSRTRGSRSGKGGKTVVNVVVPHSTPGAGPMASGMARPPMAAPPMPPRPAMPPGVPPGGAPPGTMPPGLMGRPTVPPMPQQPLQRKSGGMVESVGMHAGTRVQHSPGKNDGGDIGRGRPVTYRSGGAVDDEHDDPEFGDGHGRYKKTDTHHVLMIAFPHKKG